MNISKINDIFNTRGSAAALASAVAAQVDGWIIEKLENGTWDPTHKPAPKAREVRAQVDRHGDKKLFSIKVNGKLVRFEVETTGESGKVNIEKLDTTILAKAREMIGKSIAHPVPANAGTPTNDPKISQGMKGSSTGGGKKGK